MQIACNGDNLNEMTNPVFLEKSESITYLLSAELAKRLLKVNLSIKVGQLLFYFHNCMTIFIPCHIIVAGYYGMTLVDLVSSVCHQPVVHLFVPLYFLFLTITWVDNNGFSPNFVCALILWRSDLELLMHKFCQFLTELSPMTCPYFHFQMKTLVNINGFSPNLVCAWILLKSALGLLMGK